MAQNPGKPVQRVVMFDKEQIMPDVVSCDPEQLLIIKYNSQKTATRPGDELTPSDSSKAPEISFESESNTFYTLIMSDPDAPSRDNPIRGEWLHWLVVNIPGETPTVEKGATIINYAGPGPPKDSGLHRYTFLIYKQKRKFNFRAKNRKNVSNKIVDNARKAKDLVDIKPRAKFSVKLFLKNNNNEMTNQLIAGNYFLSQYENSNDGGHIGKLCSQYYLYFIGAFVVLLFCIFLAL